MKNTNIIKKLKNNTNHIKETLASLREDELRDLINDSEKQKEIVEYYRATINTRAFDELADFIAMFCAEYKTAGSWDKDHSNWRKQYSECSKFVY